MIFWIALITFAIMAFRRRARAGGPPWRRDPGEVALGERYARGEIDADEYTERLTVLRQARDPRRSGPSKA
ncbi:MAG: SHOCT domain-containing protein [Streptosporangiales bacterium]|nr:SHOCT domain-containing protein [Streptosporangiales bacterium]